MEPELPLAALRLLVHDALLDEALDLLERRGLELLRKGYAQSLWRLLRDWREPPLDPWRLRCAVDGASTDELSGISEPKQAQGADQLLWARVLFARGQISEAAETARSTWGKERTGDNSDLAFRAGYFLAACLANRSAWDEAVKVLDELAPSAAVDEVRRDVLAARCLTLAGHASLALSRVADLSKNLEGLPDAARFETTSMMARILFDLGRTEDALALVNRDAGAEGTLRLALYTEQGRYALFQRAMVALSRGHLDDFHDLLSGLWPFVGHSSMLRPHIVLARALSQLESGDFAELDAALADVMDRASRIGSNNLQSVAWTALIRYRVAQGDAEGATRGLDESLTQCGTNGLHLKLHCECAAVRSGKSSGETGPIAACGADYPRLSASACEVATLAQLVQGNAREARNLVEEGLSRARAHQLGLATLALSQRRLEALLILNRQTELAAAAEELAELAEELPSPRAAVEAQFFASLAVSAGVTASGSATTPNLALLAEVAASEAAPEAARRAQELLGAPTQLDELDKVVVAAARERQRFDNIARCDSIGGQPNFRDAWGCIDDEQSVWLPQGRRVNLSRRELLWRLLTVVADSGGEASKEELVQKVWQQRQYHPLRHDNRLQAAARKLRVLVEDEASRPRRFITTNEGYALGLPFFRLKRSDMGG